MARFYGYTNRATTFIFEVNETPLVITSNAYNFEDARDKANLPNDARLLSSASFRIANGRTDGNGQTKTIWAVQGTLPSGVNLAKWLVEKGLITEEEAQLIFDASENRIL